MGILKERNLKPKISFGLGVTELIVKIGDFVEIYQQNVDIRNSAFNIGNANKVNDNLFIVDTSQEGVLDFKGTSGFGRDQKKQLRYSNKIRLEIRRLVTSDINIITSDNNTLTSDNNG
jgi:hypothetical protein